MALVVGGGVGVAVGCDKGMFGVQAQGPAKSSFEAMFGVAGSVTPNIPLSP